MAKWARIRRRYKMTQSSDGYVAVDLIFQSKRKATLGSSFEALFAG